MKIAGAKVLLTGANGGIGRAFADELLRRGAGKVYLGVRNADGQTFPDDPRLEVIQLDVADTASIFAAAAKASDVNVLINNAGFAAFTGGIAAPSIDAARREMDVNYFGPLQLTRALQKSPPVFSSAAQSSTLFLSSDWQRFRRPEHTRPPSPRPLPLRGRFGRN